MAFEDPASAMTTAPDPNLGRVLKQQYRIDALLGRGGMGSVYKAEQLSVGRAVAIKLIAGDIADNPECIKRFRREAEAMATLQHPNTVRLFDFGVEASELFMVMELLEGRDLSQHLAERGALPLAEALAILREVLAALSEAHARGIVHRDLKPANVFMSALTGGQVFAKVMDFGIAGIAGVDAQAATKLTLAGSVLGTPAYMAPEQAQGLPVDARADLYSLGIMLFEMLTGRTPFEADSLVSLLMAQVTEPPPPLAKVRADLADAPELQALLDKLLAKRPEDRPTSAAEVLRDIEQPEATQRSAAPLAAVQPGVAAVPVDAVPQAAPLAASLARKAPTPAKQAMLGWALAACGLLTLLFVLLRSPGSPSGPDAPPPLPQAGAAAATEEPARASKGMFESAQAPEAEDAPVTAPTQALRPNARSTQRSEREAQDDKRPASSQRPVAASHAPNNVRSAKAAYRAGQLSAQAYKNLIRELKLKRAQQIEAEKLNYRAGRISREEYKRRVVRIDREYEG